MIKMNLSRPRDRNSDDLRERYRGFVSLPKILLAPDQARNLEAERWVTEEARAAGMASTRPATPRDESPEAEYRRLKGLRRDVPVPISLESHTIQPDQARNREAERWAVEEALSAGLNDADSAARYVGTDGQRHDFASHGGRLAQVRLPIPRLFPALPPLLYDGGRRGSPPKGPGPQNPRKPKKQCEAEYAQNQAACEASYPRVSFPGHDFFREARGSCYREATRVYSDCRTGREAKPFNPRLFYEGDD